MESKNYNLKNIFKNKIIFKGTYGEIAEFLGVTKRYCQRCGSNGSVIKGTYLIEKENNLDTFPELLKEFDETTAELKKHSGLNKIKIVKKH